MVYKRFQASCLIGADYLVAVLSAHRKHSSLNDRPKPAHRLRKRSRRDWNGVVAGCATVVVGDELIVVLTDSPSSCLPSSSAVCLCIPAMSVPVMAVTSTGSVEGLVVVVTGGPPHVIIQLSDSWRSR